MRPEEDPGGGMLEDVLRRAAADLVAPRDEKTHRSIRAAENSLYEFVKQAWHVIEPADPFTDGWHIGCICEHLQALTELQIRNLIINCPPRHSKSSLLVLWFGWTWTRDPASRWLVCTYGENLALRDGNHSKDLVSSTWYRQRWGHLFTIRKGQAGAFRFVNSRSGHRIGTTVGGKALGEGGQYLCLPPDELVWTDRGRLPIGRIVNERIPVRVWSCDTRTGSYAWNPLTSYHDNPGSSVVEVVCSDGASVRCTPDHQLWTVNRGWVRADCLRTSDILPRPALADQVYGVPADAVSGGHGFEGSRLRQDSEDVGVGDTVQQPRPRYRSPVFVRHVGYSQRTYCLTVADNHSMVAGHKQEGFLLSNCYDDPNKTQDARSKAALDAVIESWTSTMALRGNDPKTTRKLVCQQRITERDLSGFLGKERDSYEWLVLPAEYEPARYWIPGCGTDRPRDAIVPTSLQRRDPRLVDPRTEDGEPLWPARYGPAELQALKTEVQAGWAGQGQQRPSPQGGSVFKEEHFRRFTVESQSGRTVVVLHKPDGDERHWAEEFRFYQVADTAMTRTKRSAWTCVSTFAWAARAPALLVWHVWRSRVEVPYQLPAILAMRDGEAGFDPAGNVIVPPKLRPWPVPITVQAVEKKASGIGILQEAALRKKPMQALQPGSADKVTRAAAAATMYGAGQVYHRAGAKWLVDFEDELLGFPNTAYSDQVDTLSYGSLMAGESALLNAGVQGALIMEVPSSPDGKPLTLEQLRRTVARGETFDFGKYKVSFPDEEDSDGW